MNQYVLAEQDHKFVASRKWDVAVLPFGATEPHNYHLPYGTDVFQCDHIGREVCRHATEKGANVLLLPTVPFGVDTNFLKVPGGIALSVCPTTLLKILTDLTDALHRAGIRKVVLLNGHGGNELKPLIRELHHTMNDMFLCVCDWFKVAAAERDDIFTHPGEHADEMETSMGLAFFPQWVKMDQAGSGAIREMRFEAVRKGWIQITRPFHLMSHDTGIGDPREATAQKAHRLMSFVVPRIGDFIAELAKSPMDEMFPYNP